METTTSSRLHRLWWAVPLLMASLCFWQGFSGEGQAVVRVAETPQQPVLKTTPIRELQTGMRVIGDNPELVGQEIEALQIEDPAQWRNVRLEMVKPDESLLKITLLRQLEWLALNEAEVGGIIELDMPELGAAGPAEVLAIDPCPDIEPGNRPLITGTFEHTAANVIDLAIESESTPIGTTDNHPFWSQDRQEFVEAGELKIGETLSLADGRTTRVTSIIPRAGPQTVYNLEVSGEHVYHVGNTGVLVHNSCGSSVGYTDDVYGNNWDDIFKSKVPKSSSSTSVSKQLGDNLSGSTRGGDMMRNLGFDAHHIVPWDSKTQSATKLKKFMLDNGFTLDDIKYGEFNGAWLPGSARRGGINEGVKDFWKRETWHKGAPAEASKHSNATMETIRQRLLPFQGDKKAIANEIRAIGREMQDGVFRNI